LLDFYAFGPASFVETGVHLSPDFASVHLGRFVDQVKILRDEPESASLEEVSSTVNELKTRVAALDCNQMLQRAVIDELSVHVNLSSARSLEDHDEVSQSS